MVNIGRSHVFLWTLFWVLLHTVQISSSNYFRTASGLNFSFKKSSCSWRFLLWLKKTSGRRPGLILEADGIKAQPAGPLYPLLLWGDWDQSDSFKNNLLRGREIGIYFADNQKSEQRLNTRYFQELYSPQCRIISSCDKINIFYSKINLFKLPSCVKPFAIMATLKLLSSQNSLRKI